MHFLLHIMTSFLSLYFNMELTKEHRAEIVKLIYAWNQAWNYAWKRLKSSLWKFYGRYGDLIKQYEVSLSQMLNDILWPDHIQWQPPSDQTLYRTRPFTEFWVVSIEHLRRVWHADRGRLLLRTPGPVPFGLAYVLLVESKIEKVPRGIRGEKSSKDMASSRNLGSTIGALASPKMGDGTRCPEG